MTAGAMGLRGAIGLTSKAPPAKGQGPFDPI